MCRDAFNKMTARNWKNNTSNRPTERRKKTPKKIFCFCYLHFILKRKITSLICRNSRKFKNINFLWNCDAGWVGWRHCSEGRVKINGFIKTISLRLRVECRSAGPKPFNYIWIDDVVCFSTYLSTNGPPVYASNESSRPLPGSTCVWPVEFRWCEQYCHRQYLHILTEFVFFFIISVCPVDVARRHTDIVALQLAQVYRCDSMASQ